MASDVACARSIPADSPRQGQRITHPVDPATKLTATVLVALDGSDKDERAFPVAVRLAHLADGVGEIGIPPVAPAVDPASIDLGTGETA